MPWKPQHEGDFPTLGWEVIDWMTNYLAMPGRGDYEAFIPYTEQEDFLLRFYELDPKTGRRKIQRGVLSRPRGWGKSPFAGAMMAAEALAPVVFAGWDAAGQPVGRPWSDVTTPEVRVAAVSEEQTNNTWDALLELMSGPYLFDDYPGLEVMQGFVNLPGRGKIRPISASGRSAKGGRPVFVVMDQTESWVGSRGKNLYETLMGNISKTSGSALETPNAFIPGEGSVAEKSAATYELIRQGLMREESLLWDHREAPADTDMSDDASLTWGLRVAYGCASGHKDGCVLHVPPCAPGHAKLESRKTRIWDPTADVQVARSDWLNQITHASDSWVSRPEMLNVVVRDRVVSADEPVVLGFDGSAGRARGNPDATALVGMTVRDKHLFEVRVWQKGPNDGQDWRPDPVMVSQVVRECFDRFNVVGFYADPSRWEAHIAEWESQFHRRLLVKASRSSPIAAHSLKRSSVMGDLLEQVRGAIVLGEMSVSDSSVLMSHFLNARRRATRSGYLIYKSFPDSPDKIDAAYASVLAYAACMDAVSAGLQSYGQRKVKRKVGVL